MAESDASIEAQLELKKRARRRLVGAAALALLAAIVLPMVMDHEPRPPSADIQVRIPSPDAGGGLSSRILPKSPAATPLPPATTGAEARPAPEPKAEAEAVKPGQRPAAPVAAEKPVDKKPAEPVAAKAAEEQPRAKAAEGKTAAYKGEDVSSAAQAAGEQWVVQLGAYKEAGNVKLLLGKLKELGVPAFTEKFDSPQGPRTRVRAGPFASKDAAEKARVKAKIIGVDGPVAPK